jgi:hypothetical protein
MAVKSMFTQYAINFWEQKTQSRPTQEDVHQIIKNFAGFFEVLSDWQKVDQNPVQAVQDKDGMSV